MNTNHSGKSNKLLTEMKIWAELPRLAPSDAPTHQMVRGLPGQNVPGFVVRPNIVGTECDGRWCSYGRCVHDSKGRHGRGLPQARGSCRGQVVQQCSRSLRPLLGSRFLPGLLWEMPRGSSRLHRTDGWSQGKPLWGRGC